MPQSPETTILLTIEEREALQTLARAGRGRADHRVSVPPLWRSSRFSATSAAPSLELRHLLQSKTLVDLTGKTAIVTGVRPGTEASPAQWRGPGPMW